MLLLILLCTFIKDTGRFFMFSKRLIQSKSIDIFLSLNENICLVHVLSRSALQRHF